MHRCTEVRESTQNQQQYGIKITLRESLKSIENKENIWERDDRRISLIYRFQMLPRRVVGLELQILWQVLWSTTSKLRESL